MQEKSMKLMTERGLYWQDDGGLELERLDREMIKEMIDSNLTSSMYQFMEEEDLIWM